MKKLRSSSLAVSWPLLVAAALSAGGAAGCSVGESNDLDPEIQELTLPDGVSVVGEFKVHLNPNDGRMEIWRITRPLPGRTPLSQSDLTIVQDDTAGSGPANTVELVTNSTGQDGM